MLAESFGCTSSGALGSISEAEAAEHQCIRGHVETYARSLRLCDRTMKWSDEWASHLQCEARRLWVLLTMKHSFIGNAST